MEAYQRGGGEGRMGGKVHGLRRINLVQNRQGEVKNSIGNREEKELICMTHGHELREGMLVGGGYRAEWDKGVKIMGQV